MLTASVWLRLGERVNQDLTVVLEIIPVVVSVNVIRITSPASTGSARSRMFERLQRFEGEDSSPIYRQSEL
jgi:hypothetical protein